MQGTIKGIVIDAGHGGEDTGYAANGLLEKDLNLEAAQYIYGRFQELGVPVTLIRDSDETITPEERVRRILAAYGDDPNVIVISNHINSGGGEGAEVVYALRNTSDLARTVLENIEQSGQQIRKYYQRRLPENPIKDYYFIHRNTGSTQPLFIEYGFIDNVDDAARLQNNLLDFAEGVVRGVAEYAGIPYTPPVGSKDEYYVVQAGDSLWSIANRFGLSVQRLRELNNLSSDDLQVGQLLRIAETDIEAPGEEQEYITYIVQPNDSLYKIARTYNTTVDAIQRLNNLSSNDLIIGQELLIPVNEDAKGSTYTVQQGDSLWLIANRFGVNVQDLIQANNLANIELQIGDQLIIPSSLSPTTSTYTVQNGDSLWSIAKRYNTTVDRIKEANNLSTNLLQIGQQLKIPS